MEEMRKWILLIRNSRMSSVMSALQLIDQPIRPTGGQKINEDYMV